VPSYRTDTGQIEVLEWGDGPELWVLLHAAATGPRGFTGLAEALARPHRRIVAPALQRYGATSVVEDGGRLAAHMAVAAWCLARYPAGRRVLFGHSMGGLIALMLAGADEPAGAAVDSLVLYEPIALACLDPDDPVDRAEREWDRRLIADFARRMAEGNPEAGIAGFINAWNETAWDSLPASGRARLIQAAADILTDIQDDGAGRLAPERIAAGTLTLWGAESPPIMTRIRDRLRTRLRRETSVVLDGAGHMAPLLAPVAVAAAIEAWLIRPGCQSPA